MLLVRPTRVSRGNCYKVRLLLAHSREKPTSAKALSGPRPAPNRPQILGRAQTRRSGSRPSSSTTAGRSGSRNAHSFWYFARTERATSREGTATTAPQVPAVAVLRAVRPRAVSSRGLAPLLAALQGRRLRPAAALAEKAKEGAATVRLDAMEAATLGRPTDFLAGGRYSIAGHLPCTPTTHVAFPKGGFSDPSAKLPRDPGPGFDSGVKAPAGEHVTIDAFIARPRLGLESPVSEGESMTRAHPARRRGAIVLLLGTLRGPVAGAASRGAGDAPVR